MSQHAEPNGATPLLKHTFDKHVTLYIGGVHASEEPILIRTFLGSCIAVCLYDPTRRVGGMNHFMLPRAPGEGADASATRFGIHAMDRLITAVMKVGGDRRQLVAKVFGGAHVLGNLADTPASVPRQNSEFAREFLRMEGIAVKGWDVGGDQPREVHFHSHTGRAFVRRLEKAPLRDRLVQRECREEAKQPAFGSVTFFVKDEG